MALTIKRRVNDFPARVALRITNYKPIRQWLARRHRAAAERHRPNLPPLAANSASIVDALEKDGIAVVSLSDLAIEGADIVLSAAQDLARFYAPEAQRRVAAGEDLIYIPASAVAGRPEIYRLGLDACMLDIAEAYLGVPVGYDGVTLFYTVADGREVATRRWHRDWEDRRTLKIGVYCSDVGPGDGPFEHIGREDRTQGEEAGFHYAPASSEELEARLGADYRDAITSCEGPAGTMIFAETARYFHRGAPALTGDRVALFYSYFARRPLHPFFCERSGLSRRQIAELARGMSARQSAAAFWRKSLPQPLRLIPPARL